MFDKNNIEYLFTFAVAPFTGSVDWNTFDFLNAPSVLQSLPLPGAWIEIALELALVLLSVSLPLPGAWIEICKPCDWKGHGIVAPFTGSVDWNTKICKFNSR